MAAIRGRSAGFCAAHGHGLHDDGPMIEPASSPTPRTGPGSSSGPAPSAASSPPTSTAPTLGRLLRDDAVGWAAVLARPGDGSGPAEPTWSPLEYACHVRDVHRIFGERLALMLDEDEPPFANWDQDETAVAERYDRQDPAAGRRRAGGRGRGDGGDVRRRRRATEGPGRRRGLRSDGSEFTVDTPRRATTCTTCVHHIHDVARRPARATVAAYDGDADGLQRRHAASSTTRSARSSTRFAAPSAPGARCSRSAAAGVATRSRSRRAGSPSGAPTSRRRSSS